VTHSATGQPEATTAAPNSASDGCERSWLSTMAAEATMNSSGAIG
jgi:hypothetical protein